MSAHVADAAERAAALDPRRSFIVQAPAGSGKTGLLIQRYLGLLATVAKPEEILAITFTRKAAAEMRRRVIEALQGAQSPQPPAGDNEALTWKLARAALERDAQHGWRLLENAARLRIQTIDSLCASLARQMPVLSRLGATPSIVENPEELYREAAERTFALVNSTGDPLSERVARVLDHLDGDWATVRGLVERMLARRDQWLPRVDEFGDRAALEAAFRAERAKVMAQVHALLPAPLAARLVPLARYAGDNLATMEPSSPLAILAGLMALPEPDEAGADAWCAMATLLLTQKVKFRGAVDKRAGFPSGKGVDPARKSDMLSLLAAFEAQEGLCEAFHALREMPPPKFTDAQWDVLAAMAAILPRAAAMLLVVFAERGEIDFTGIAASAVIALGDEDAPTDLLLALDVRLQHLLVDEFQDTSQAQWELLTRLTAGWTDGDGRTAFLVGDPMQSIYRFREADVALFLRAWRDGLPNVRLTGLRLKTNFRSQAGIVDWFNAHFPNILAREEDANSGAVPYAPASAHHPASAGEAVTWHVFLGTEISLARDREAARVVEVVREAQAADPAGSIAILVRNRSNLDRIVPQLRAAGIGFRAVDIEPLGGRQVIQDLLAITRSLAHPADRVAWLAVLRAPWCALTLRDIRALTGAPASKVGARETVWELASDATRVASLSSEGRERLAHVRSVLAPFVDHPLRGTLRERVEAAWLGLGGPLCANAASDLEDAETFFDQLDQLEDAGELTDSAVLEEHLAELYAAPDVGEEARVQVMTIHKAKGLEFDTVIVPGLYRVPRAPDRPLFAWKAHVDGSLLMAPIRPTGEERDAAYDYLRKLDRVASEHEVERLFYVAATRARERLHLFGYVRLVPKDTGWKLRPPNSRLLLGKAWSAACEAFEAEVPATFVPEEKPAKPQIHTTLRRLDLTRRSVDVQEPACMQRELPAGGEQIAFRWVNETSRHIGTITHRWLQRIATEGLSRWDGARVATLAPQVARELARMGIPPSERENASARVLDALRGAIADERGRWVLGDHPDARCEYRIRVPSPDGVKLLVIDRLFHAGGRPWIVDYKTSSHEGADLEQFLDREQERYADKMARYVPAFGGAPGSLGLYFPLVKGWREWDADA